MNCERCQAELEDFLYGELAEREVAAVRMHLAACAACTQARVTLERENEIFAQYYEQTALEPAPEVWQAIQTRICAEAAPTSALVNETKTTGWFGGMLVWLTNAAVLRQAAVAVALVVLSVLATTYYFKAQQQKTGEQVAVRSTPTPVVAPSVPPNVSPNAPSTAEVAQLTAPTKNATRPSVSAQPKLSEEQLIQNQIARAEREYQGAIKLLDRVIARHRDEFAPGLLQQYQNSLALIDNSIAESRRALRERPADAASGQFLLAAYAKKLELMQEIATQAGQ